MSNKFTVDEMKAKLTEQGVAFPADASEEELAKLLSAALTAPPKSPAPASPKVTAPSLDTVAVPKATLDSLLERLQTLEQLAAKDAVETTEQRKNKNRTVRVHFVDGKLVVGYGKTKTMREVDGSEHLHIEVKTEDGKAQWMPFQQYFEDYGNQQEAEILEKKTTITEVKQGHVFKTVHDYDNYRSYETTESVPVVSIVPSYTLTLKLQDGKIVTLDASAVN